MLRDMYNLMRHVLGATTLVTRLRRALAHYRCGRDTTCDQQFASSYASSDDHDQGSDHRSPRNSPDNDPPLASSSSHHGEEAGPSSTSN